MFARKRDFAWRSFIILLIGALCLLLAEPAGADVRVDGYEPDSCTPHGALLDPLCAGAFSQCHCTYLPDGGTTQLVCPGAVNSSAPPSGTYFYHRVTTCAPGQGPTFSNPPFSPRPDEMSCGHMIATSYSAPGSTHTALPYAIVVGMEMMGMNDWTHDCSPVADAGQNKVVCPGAVVTLDGSASRDPKNDPLTFAWSQLGGPSVSLAGVDTPAPSFRAALPPGSVLSFTLTVRNVYGIRYPLQPGGQSSDTVTVTVGVPVPGSQPSKGSSSGPPFASCIRLH